MTVERQLSWLFPSYRRRMYGRRTSSVRLLSVAARSSPVHTDRDGTRAAAIAFNRGTRWTVSKALGKVAAGVASQAAPSCPALERGHTFENRRQMRYWAIPRRPDEGHSG